MAIENGKLQLEKYAVAEFKKFWKANSFRGQRYGQAFYNHFRLHSIADQRQLQGLYEADGEAAEKIIANVFRFN